MCPGEKKIREILGDRKLPVWNHDRNKLEPPWTEESITLANRIIENTLDELAQSKEIHDKNKQWRRSQGSHRSGERLPNQE